MSSARPGQALPGLAWHCVPALLAPVTTWIASTGQLWASCSSLTRKIYEFNINYVHINHVPRITDSCATCLLPASQWLPWSEILGLSTVTWPD